MRQSVGVEDTKKALEVLDQLDLSEKDVEFLKSVGVQVVSWGESFKVTGYSLIYNPLDQEHTRVNRQLEKAVSNCLRKEYPLRVEETASV